ncbi:uncharacterized protein LOC136063278 [Quercus suber]|uniref:uncharacterized protein LOC136063278 n=1 Tax=Quercus suber TaxID=58331 RepID=UPI0032DEB98E
MDSKKRPSLKGLIAKRNKGGTSKDIPQTLPPADLPPHLPPPPPPPPPPTDLQLQANPNLKKKRPSQDLEEGRVAPRKGFKQQKTAKDPKDKRASSMDSRDEAEVIQQAYMVEEWVRNTHNKVEAESHSQREVEKALRALKEEHTALGNKLKEVDNDRKSALAGLKTAEAQAKDQRKQLYTTKINLATQKQLVLDLRAELQKVKDAAKEVAQVAKEAADDAVIASYERRVKETEKRLPEEVVEVCRDYCTVSWMEVLNNARVPANFELRKAKSDLALDAEISPGAVGKGKEVLPSAKDTPSEDNLSIKDIVSQVKAAESKFEAGDAKLKVIDPKKGSQPT